jgi:predicted transcriptional regulator
MRQEIQALETTSNQTNWKEKSQELYDICVQIKEENSYLVERCKQIAALAVNMMNQLNEQKPQAQSLVEPDLSKLTENLKNARR